MTDLRVLFVPYQRGTLSHGIPLLALHRLLPRENVNCAFLLPAQGRRIFEMCGVRVLDIDHHNLGTEMAAYDLFRPDVVVDDTSITTYYGAQLMSIPRVSIVRTGSFPGDTGGPFGRRHSLDFPFKELAQLDFLGIARPRTLADICKGDINIIPGLPSVELLPQGLRPEDYVYAGPLIAEDRYAASADSVDFHDLRDFFRRVAGRKLVYVTLGTVAVSSNDKAISQLISRLSNSGLAIVTNVRSSNVDERSEFVFRADYLPMHLVCSRADVVIHHCGSGTYHYPLLHRRPSVTVGTDAYDRENVAMQLQQLGISTHVVNGPGESNAVDQCIEAITRWLALDISAIELAYAPIKRELDETAANFDFFRVLETAVQRIRFPRSRSPQGR